MHADILRQLKKRLATGAKNAAPTMAEARTRLSGAGTTLRIAAAHTASSAPLRKWGFFALFTAVVFGSGVYCGTLLHGPYSEETTPAQSLAVTKQESGDGAPAVATLPATPQAQAVEQTPPQAHETQQSDTTQQPGQPTQPGQQAQAVADAGQSLTVAYAPNRPPIFRGDERPFTPSASSFSFKKLGTGNGPTLMVVGGIQGDEPGGFSAASLIASHYKITSGTVWVVPDLNFLSIINRSRGNSGDMNRKFAALDSSDPDYEIVTRIKSILLDEKVSLILNLHDGSGFFRPTYESDLKNPKRWGQSVIIDQANLSTPHPFGDLQRIASAVEKDVNEKLIKPEHRYHTHNTLTAEGNTEMEKTLSYFAVCNGKPAFGVEASKEFSTEYRAYYHLNAIESFMRQMGIQFERDFPLTPKGVARALNTGLNLTAFNDKVVLQLDNVRPRLNLIPFPKKTEPDLRSSKPLISMTPENSRKLWKIAYGNRVLTRLVPEYLPFDDSLKELSIIVDGKAQTVKPGDIVTVRKKFMVENMPGYRVNAIGAQKEKNGTEAGVALVRKDFMPHHSVDKKASIYRVEVYKGKAFSGMVLVRFGEPELHVGSPLTAITGEESALGM